MTWIEVADSAIKIGLGALLGGVFALLTSRIALAREARHRYANRRRDLIERAVDKLVEYEKTYRHQKAMFDTLVQIPQTSRDASPLKRDFATLDEKLRLGSEIFAEVTGILLVLGEPDVEASMEEYRVLCSDWHGKSLDSMSETEAATLTPLRESIIVKRREFMAKLAAIYRNE